MMDLVLSMTVIPYKWHLQNIEIFTEIDYTFTDDLSKTQLLSMTPPRFQTNTDRLLQSTKFIFQNKVQPWTLCTVSFCMLTIRKHLPEDFASMMFAGLLIADGYSALDGQYQLSQQSKDHISVILKSE